ncbi:hypothetical protein ACLUUI_11490 [Enterobacterales bacterium AW_CKDN230030176-1A_HGKHYDSX7]
MPRRAGIGKPHAADQKMNKPLEATRRKADSRVYAPYPQAFPHRLGAKPGFLSRGMDKAVENSEIVKTKPLWRDNDGAIPAFSTDLLTEFPQYGSAAIGTHCAHVWPTPLF